MRLNRRRQAGEDRAAQSNNLFGPWRRKMSWIALAGTAVVALDSVPEVGEARRIGYEVQTESQTLSERPHRARRVGRHRAFDSRGRGWGAALRQVDICRILDALFYRTREGCTWRALPLRLPALEDRLQLLPVVRFRLHLESHPTACASGSGSEPAGSRPPCRRHRQPVGQDGRGRPRSAAPTAARRSTAANAISWWTRWGC